MCRLCAFALLGTLGLVAGCGSVPSAPTPVGMVTSVKLSPSVGQFLAPNGTLTITAVITGVSNKEVNWTLSGPGSLSSKTANPVTYTAPSSVAGNTAVVITATVVASSSSTAYLPLTVLPAAAVTNPNLQPVSVDGGPVPPYVDGAFTSVTICSPGTTNCKTVDGILVDTGSEGLRILASQITQVSLTTLTDSNGNTLNDCAQFQDGSFLWGQVDLADVRIAGEVAGQLPVHVVADPTGGSSAIPSDCSNGGTDEDNQAKLGANGVLGIGLEPTDCYTPGTGSPCDQSTGLASSPPGPAYYGCSSSGCSAAYAPVSDQVANPTVYFAKDNNGVLLSFPTLTGSAATLDGSLFFGIGTQSNNELGSATAYALNANDNFVTLFQGQTLVSSFIDSGTNGMFFPTSLLTVCGSPNQRFYCPAYPSPETATNEGAVGSPVSTITFSINDANTLLGSGDAAISTLGGPNGTASTCTTAGGSCSFVWGLPFFFMCPQSTEPCPVSVRNVFTAVDGQSTPAGTGPFWAY